MPCMRICTTSKFSASSFFKNDGDKSEGLPCAQAGFASGLKSMAKGVVAGAAGLVAAPALGAAQEGVTGFAKGLATGTA